MIKKITIYLCMIGFIAILTACGAKEPNKIAVVLDWTVNTNHTGLYVALDKDYYKAEGLEVEIQAPPQSGAATLVASGTVQFGVSYQEEVTYARAADIPLKAIAAIIQNNTSGFASRIEAGVVTPKDFEDKRYGGWGSPVEEAMLQALMDKYDADYKRLQILSVGDMDFFAATEKDVDFTWIFRGWDGVAAELKGIEINYIDLGKEDAALNYYTPVLISNEAFLESHPETVKRFLKAVQKGYAFAIDNPVEAADILLKYAPELDKELVHASQAYLANEYQSDAANWGVMKAQVWKDYADWLFQRDLLETGVDTDAAFTNEFLQ